MLGAIRNLFAPKQPPVIDESLQKIIITIENIDDEPKDKLNGWYDFIADTVPSLKRKAGAMDYVPGTGLCKYEVELQKTIAGHIFFRTGRHPNLEQIIELEHDAATNYNHIKQLAYNCMMYEAQLVNTPTTEHLDALREITAELA
jgi:hypothetical protein